MSRLARLEKFSDELLLIYSPLRGPILQSLEALMFIIFYIVFIMLQAQIGNYQTVVLLAKGIPYITVGIMFVLFKNIILIVYRMRSVVLNK